MMSWSSVVSDLEKGEKKTRYGNGLTSNRYIGRTSDVGVTVHTLESDMFTKAKGRLFPCILFLPFAAGDRDVEEMEAIGGGNIAREGKSIER